MVKTLSTYDYKGFLIIYDGCDTHPGNWYARDSRDYDESIGSNPTDICTKTLREAKEEISKLLAKPSWIKYVKGQTS